MAGMKCRRLLLISALALLAGCAATRESTMETLTKNIFGVPVNREEVSRDWKARGYSCDLFTDPPGREWKNFVHETDELVTVVEGVLEMTVAGETVIARPGDEVFIPRRAIHSVKNIHDGTSHWLYGYN